jgi:hypothetical protein
MSAAKSTKKRKQNLVEPEANSAKVAKVAKVNVPYFAFKTRTRTVDKDGKEILFKLRNGQNRTEIYDFFKSMIVSNEGIKLADDGIYTWILIASDKDPYGDLYAAKTISMQEIGTLHKNIYDTMTKSKPVIIAAGEFDKKGKKIIFNLLSGTYMEPKVKGKNSPTRKVIMQSAANSITKKLIEYALNVTKTSNNILAKTQIRTSPKTIAQFKKWFNYENAVKPANAANA